MKIGSKTDVTRGSIFGDRKKQQCFVKREITIALIATIDLNSLWLKTAGFLKYVRRFNGHQALKGYKLVLMMGDKCPYSEFFWSVFSRNRTVWMRENTDQKNSHITSNSVTSKRWFLFYCKIVTQKWKQTTQILVWSDDHIMFIWNHIENFEKPYWEIVCILLPVTSNISTWSSFPKSLVVWYLAGHNITFSEP